MSQPFTQINFRDEDHTPLNVEQLSRHARVSRALIRICIDQGCPAEGGRLSQAMLMEWLFENYARFRQCAGMPEIALVVVAESGRLAKCKMGNALLTLLEFSELRSSCEIEKRHIRNVRRMVASALERV